MNLLRFILKTTDGIQRYIFGFIVCTIIIAIDANLKPYLIKLFIDSFNNKSANFSLVFLFIASQSIMIIAYALNDWFGTRFHSEYRSRIPHIFLDKLTNYDYKFFQENMSGTIVAKITDAFNVIFVIIFQSINIFGKFFITTLISLALLFNINKAFALFLILWLCFYVIFCAIFVKYSIYYNKDYAPIRPKIYGQVNDYLTNILSVWNFQMASKEKERLELYTNEFKMHATIYGKFIAKSYVAQGLSLVLYISLCILMLVFLQLNGQISSGDFALVFMISYKIGDTLFSIAQEVLGFSQNLGAAMSAIALLDKDEALDAKNTVDKIADFKNSNIKFSNVKFQYSNSSTINEYDNLEIKTGQKVGLVGYSGSGKSTFVNLILRLYEVTDGAILIDSQDIKNVTHDSLRKHIAIIPQDPTLFHRSLMENIRYGKIDATDEEVIEASKKAHAHEFIQDLSAGYEALVGERGIKLSGGQRQRIAIARAILKNAPILILDEATSALDSLTESLIQESLMGLMQNKTTIVIAHRLSTLQNMNRVLVFDKGKIVEDGTHNELLMNNSLYKDLWEHQAGGFLKN